MFQSGVASKIPKCRYTGIFEIIHIAIPVFEKIPVYPVYRFSLDDLDDRINTSSNSEHGSDENDCLGENHSHSHPSLCPKSPTNKRQVKVKVKVLHPKFYDVSQGLTSLLFMRSC